MLPAYRHGQIVVAMAPYGRLQPGQVIIFRHNGLEKVKRIAAVRPDGVFVIGDNQTASTDSRSFGWLDITAVRGRVIWPQR
jgi:type IV secretory pathway protease TraF